MHVRASRRGPDVGATFSSTAAGASRNVMLEAVAVQLSSQPTATSWKRISPGEKKEPSKGFPRLAVVDCQNGWCRNDGGVMQQ